jgi:lipoyl-dependent peroxiredoxin subunit C
MNNRVLGIGNEFPAFEKKAVVSIEYAKEFGTVNNLEHRNAGKWLLLFWWPKDFHLCLSDGNRFFQRSF